jgi:hypothetical protein
MFPAYVFIGQTVDCTNVFQISDVSGKATSYTQGTIQTSTGTWNHLAYVYEKTDLRIYVNGTLSTRGSSGSINSSSVNTSRNYNYLGMATLGYMNVGNSMLDEVRLYNKALSQTQVQLDMARESYIAPGIC